MTQPDHDHASVKAELDWLTTEFFRAVSFEEGEVPPYDNIYGLFIEAGLIVKNTASTQEISSVRQFIEPRLAMLRSGEMTSFYEAAHLESTEVFGKVAHRFYSYAKSRSRLKQQHHFPYAVNGQWRSINGRLSLHAESWRDK